MRFDALLPRPRRLERLPGRCRLGPRLRLAGAGAARLPVGRLGRWLDGQGWSEDPGAASELRLELDDLAGHGAEGFLLAGHEGGCRLSAAAPAGLSRGLALLGQLQERPGAALDGGAFRVEDAPVLAWRGLLLDTARHRPPVSELLALLDDLAEHRLNGFHWHFCDDQGWSVPLPGAPLPGSPEDAYTEGEVAAVLARARELDLTVMPELDLPGHVLALLEARPGLGCTGGPYARGTGWGVYDDVLCLGRPGLLAELEPWLEGLLALFDSPVIHLGGDEAPATRWADCPRCRARVRELGLPGPAALQGVFAAELAAWLERRGRRLAAWDDLQERGAPPGTRLFAWRGTEALRRALRGGHETVACPMEPCYLDRYPGAEPGQPRAIGGRLDWRECRTFEPLSGLDPSEAALVVGGQACLWSEYVEDGATLRERLLPRLAALAEAMWSGPAGREDFPERLARHLPRLGRLGRTPRLDPPLEAPARWLLTGGELRLPLAGTLPGSRIEVLEEDGGAGSAEAARVEEDARGHRWLRLPAPAGRGERAWRLETALGDLRSRAVELRVESCDPVPGATPAGQAPGLEARWFGCAAPDWRALRWTGPAFPLERARMLEAPPTGADPCPGARPSRAGAETPVTPPLPPLADEGPRPGLRLAGWLRLAGTRTGHLGCEGGELARLWLGGRLLVDHDGFRPAQEAFAPVSLGPGLHALVLEVLDLRGGALRFGWRGEDGSLEEFRPDELLRP